MPKKKSASSQGTSPSKYSPISKKMKQITRFVDKGSPTKAKKTSKA